MTDPATPPNPSSTPDGAARHERSTPDAAPPVAAPPVAPSVAPSLLDLTLAFAKISISGFGGVLPWWRRALVDEKRWMTAEEFNRLFALCHFLPGPNIINMAAAYGLRLHGVVGAIVCVLALTAPATAIMIGVGVLYARYGSLPGVSGAVAGLAAGVAGLMIATALRMAAPLARKPFGPGPLIAAAAFLAVGVFRLPMLPVLAVLAPVSIALAWRARR